MPGLERKAVVEIEELREVVVVGLEVGLGADCFWTQKKMRGMRTM